MAKQRGHVVADVLATGCLPDWTLGRLDAWSPGTWNLPARVRVQLVKKCASGCRRGCGCCRCCVALIATVDKQQQAAGAAAATAIIIIWEKEVREAFEVLGPPGGGLS